jgi:hypothetical protein
MAPDLLAWPEIAEAKAAVAAAHAGAAEAARRVRCAPHGEKITRLKALQTAVSAALKAELDLARLLASEA